MKLIVGLGNPGSSYKRSRHNIGFMVLNRLASDNGLSFSKRKNYEYVAGSDYLLIKPRTYMNRSGIAVSSALTSYPVSELLVISDDFSIPLAKFRFRRKGSAGGHNGLKSIISLLGTDEFYRFRIGIGSCRENIDQADYVLSNFSMKELKSIKLAVRFASEILKIYLDQDFDTMLDYYSRNKNTYSEELKGLQDQSPKEVINE